VLAHRGSITMSTDFCVEALAEAITGVGRPEIFNTDPGSQFTSAEFTDLLIANGILAQLVHKPPLTSCGRWTGVGSPAVWTQSESV
jgi:transposase InsO family protein